MKPITPDEPLGFLGLGAMGGAMAANLIKAGYHVRGYDPSDVARTRFAERGGTPVASMAEVVAGAAVVMTSLPTGEVFRQVAEAELLPRAAEGQVFVDFGTSPPPETRMLAARFAESGAALIDAPVTGGAPGAEKGNLRMFVGADEASLARVRPLLEVVANPEEIFFAGPPGHGMIVKAGNQLLLGLSHAAAIEALSCVVNAGIDLEFATRALGGDGIRMLARRVGNLTLEHGPERVGVKSEQYPYFLAEAEAKGFRLPMAEALMAFLKDAPLLAREANRMSPAYYRELTKDHAPPAAT